MAIFSYKASSFDGSLVEGVIEAADETMAIERLRDSGVIPLRISPPREQKRKFSFRRPRADLLSFTTELTALLGAGLPLDRSLNILSDISENREMNTVVKSVLRSIREGSTFSDALQKHERIFPRVFVNMVRAGEAGGVLDVVLEKLNQYLESTKELREHVISAMIYPAILLLTGVSSVIVLFLYVLPKFSTIFAEMGSALPLPTRILIALSGFFASYWWLLALILAFAAVTFRSAINTDGGRLRWDSFKIRLLGDVIPKLETARFCRTLGTLLKSGVPLLQALNNSRDTVSNRVIASAIDTVSKGAKEGKGIAEPLAAANVLPPLALSMIRVGEETGQLDDMLLKVAATYEKSLQVSLKRFLSFLEPVMILGMAVVIGFIVLSMLMAVFSMTDLPL